MPEAHDLLRLMWSERIEQGVRLLGALVHSQLSA